MAPKSTHIILPERAPTLGVPLRYFLLGAANLAALLLFTIWKAPLLVADYLHNPGTLVLTHLFTLGFAGSVVTGALYQITPVLLFTTLRSPRMANVHLVLHGAGVAAMVWGFYETLTAWTIVGGSMVITGALLFGLNMAATLRKVERWNSHGVLMAIALCYYAATLGWGIVMAVNQRYGFLQSVEGAHLGTHITFGFLGWFGLMVVAVGLKLVPMFAPAAPLPEWLIRSVGGSLALGVTVTVTGLLLRDSTPPTGGGVQMLVPAGLLLMLVRAGLLLMAGGLLGYLGSLIYTYKVRRSQNRPIDFSVRFALSAAMLLPLPVLGLLPAGRSAQAALVLLYALGFVGGTIMGMLLRIVPFMVWLHRFRGRTAKLERIPFLHEMFHYRLGWAAYIAWFPGVALMAAGMAWRQATLMMVGALIALIGTAAFVTAIYQILRQVPHGSPPRYPGGTDPATRTKPAPRPASSDQASSNQASPDPEPPQR